MGKIIMPRSWSRHTFVRFLFTPCWFVTFLSSCFLLPVITVCVMKDVRGHKLYGENGKNRVRCALEMNMNE